MEYLGENAMNRGEFAEGLNYAMREREIAQRFIRASAAVGVICALRCVQRISMKQELSASSLKESHSGNHRRSSPDNLDEGKLRCVPCETRWYFFDQALQLAQENFAQAETLGLLYTRAEGRRTLAQVRLARGEAEEAERLCAEALELVSSTESRVSRLWLGPVYLESLLAVAQEALANGDAEKVNAKRERAVEHLKVYQELVGECQSPLFKGEAKRLSQLLALPASA